MSSEGMVSVIIPCYNSARFIASAVDSVLAQTYRHIEIVVVNDGSTDNFFTVIEPYLSQVRVINQANSGQSVARNRGIDDTQSEFVAFLDADDLWHRDKIAQQIAFLRKHPACGLVYSDRLDIDETGRPLEKPCYDPRPLPSGVYDHLAGLVLRNYIPMSSVVVRRAVLRDERFAPELTPCEDWDLWLRLASHTHFGYIKAPLSFYRFHDLNSSRDLRGMWCSMVGVMDGVLLREKNQEVRQYAIRTRGKYLVALAHLEYEGKNFVTARRWFRAAVPRLELEDILRYAATFLPRNVLSPPRAIWRVFRRRRQGSLNRHC